MCLLSEWMSVCPCKSHLADEWANNCFPLSHLTIPVSNGLSEQAKYRTSESSTHSLNHKMHFFQCTLSNVYLTKWYFWDEGKNCWHRHQLIFHPFWNMRLSIWVSSMPIANCLCACTVHIVHIESNLVAVVYYIVCAYICLCLFVFMREKTFLSSTLVL